MRVARGERSDQSLQQLMREDKRNQLFAEAPTAMPLVDDHIRKQKRRRIVGHAARKADLLARMIHTKTERVFNGSRDGLPRPLLCPLGIVEHLIYALDLEQLFIIADQIQVKLSFHMLPVPYLNSTISSLHPISCKAVPPDR